MVATVSGGSDSSPGTNIGRASARRSSSSTPAPSAAASSRATSSAARLRDAARKEPPRPTIFSAANRSGDEALDERERRVGHRAPSVIDRQRMTAVLELDDLGHGRVVLLPLVG